MSNSRKILLVGSVPLRDASDVFAALATTLGTLAPRYPDGETGHRTNWIRWQRNSFDKNAAFELENPAPLIRGIADTQSRPIYRLKRNYDPGAVRFGELGYSAEATASYAVFREMKKKGIVPATTRLQVSLPTALNLVSSFVTMNDRATVEPEMEVALKNEVDRILSAVPVDELAIQWDAVFEIVGYDGGYPLHYGDILKSSIERMARHIDFAPDDVEVGIHLCYGDPGHKHIIEPQDLGSSVTFANAISNGPKRRVNWIHMPVVRDWKERRFFEPLKLLNLDYGTELYLGLIHQRDGFLGTMNRIKLAEQFVVSFGIATECGFGRRPPETIPQLLDLHVQASLREGALAE